MAVDFADIRRRSLARMLSWEDLQPKQQTYALLRVKGYTQAEAAAEIGLSQGATAAWETRQWWPAIQAHALELVTRNKAPVVALSGRALAALTELLEDGPPKLRAEIAMYVLDHTYGKPTTRVQVKASTLPAESLDDLLDRLPSIEARMVDE